MSHELIAITMFSTMMLMLLTGQRVFGAIGFVGAVAAIIVLGEIVGPRRWSAIGIGFAGMLIIVRPGFAEINLGAICILVAVLLQTGNTMVVKILTRTEHPDTIAIGEFPIDTLFPGILLIVISGLTIIWREQRNKPN